MTHLPGKISQNCFWAIVVLCTAMLIPSTSLATGEALLDSLRRELAAAESDSARIYWHQRLTWTLMGSDVEAALLHNDSSQRIAQSLSDSMALARGDYYRGLALRLKGDYAEAIPSLQQSLAYFEKHGTAMQSTGPLFNLGVVYGLIGNYEKSLEYYFREIAINEAENYDFGRGNTMNSIGSIYRKMGQFQKAKAAYKEAIEILKPLDKPWNTANALSNLGGVYIEEGKPEKAQHYVEQALELDRSIDDRWGIAYNLHRLGEIFRLLGQNNEARKHFEEALEIREDMGQKMELAETIMALGELLFENGERKRGLEMLKNATKLSAEIGAIESQTQAERILARCYRELGQHAKAFDHLENYTSLRDSVLNEKRFKQVSELQTRYETARKDQLIAENELALAERNARISRQQTAIKASAVGILVLLVFLLLLLYTLRTRKKLNAQRIENMRKEQEVLVLESVMQGEEKERSRIARELHDGLSGLLAAIKIQFTALQQVEPDGSLDDRYNLALERLDEASREVRRIAHNMMPEILEKFGLTEALSEYVSSLNSAGAIRVRFDHFGMDQSLPLTVERVLYRVIQELLNNAIKHSKASEIMVQMNRTEQHISITVEDDGVGFDTDKVKEQAGMGLSNLQWRVRYLKGELSVESGPGKGTAVYINIELNQHGDAYDTSGHN